MPHYDPELFRLWQTDAAQTATRERTIQVPIAVVLGHYEKLTDTELHELRSDVLAEISRRNPNHPA